MNIVNWVTVQSGCSPKRLRQQAKLFEAHSIKREAKQHVRAGLWGPSHNTHVRSNHGWRNSQWTINWLWRLVYSPKTSQTKVETPGQDEGQSKVDVLHRSLALEPRDPELLQGHSLLQTEAAVWSGPTQKVRSVFHFQISPSLFDLLVLLVFWSPPLSSRTKRQKVILKNVFMWLPETEGGLKVTQLNAKRFLSTSTQSSWRSLILHQLQNVPTVRKPSTAEYWPLRTLVDSVSTTVIQGMLPAASNLNRSISSPLTNVWIGSVNQSIFFWEPKFENILYTF